MALRDYCLALIKTEDPEPVAKANCVEQLKDFIGDSAQDFVDDAFYVISTRNYDPAQRAPKTAAPVYGLPKRATFDWPRKPHESRKRSYHDGDAEQHQIGRVSRYTSGERPVKQSRRGGKRHEGRGGSIGVQQYGGVVPYVPQQQLSQLPTLPTPPPGMPPFDPSNPMSSLIAMGQLMGLPMPPMDGIDVSPPNGIGRRCRDYDERGFCARGISCPYNHGENPYVVPQTSDEYDPFLPAPMRTGQVDTSTVSRGRRGARGRVRAGWRGGKHRSEFALHGRNHDRSNTAIVIEQIPDDYFDQQKVRDFFQDFGDVESVTMQPYKRVAIVRYASWESAQAAYDSPKSIFGNRFVKVYWFKPDTIPRPGKGHALDDATNIEIPSPEPDFDPEEIARQQEEAQRKYDEAKQQREEVMQRRQEVDAKLMQMELERKRLADQLAHRTGDVTQSTIVDTDNPQTKSLKEQLAKLEAEAKTLGIDPDNMSVSGSYMATNGYSSGFPRPRGGYRGRRAKGYHQPSYRGGYGGDGFTPRKSVMSLDNRPKTLSIKFPSGQYEDHEETLRQYLMFNGMETATLAKHPERGDTALVAFQQRFEGENVMDAAVGVGPLAASNLPGQLGKLDLTWYTGAKPAAAPVANDFAANGGGDVEVKMENGHAPQENDVKHDDVQQGMDTFDDEDLDRWNG